MEVFVGGAFLSSSSFSTISSNASFEPMTKWSSTESGKARWRCFDFSEVISARSESGYC